MRPGSQFSWCKLARINCSTITVTRLAEVWYPFGWHGATQSNGKMQSDGNRKSHRGNRGTQARYLSWWHWKCQTWAHMCLKLCEWQIVGRSVENLDNQTWKIAPFVLLVDGLMNARADAVTAQYSLHTLKLASYNTTQLCHNNNSERRLNDWQLRRLGQFNTLLHCVQCQGCTSIYGHGMGCFLYFQIDLRPIENYRVAVVTDISPTWKLLSKHRSNWQASL